MNNSESLEARFVTLERQLDRLRAYQDIQSVMARYEVIHTPAQINRSSEVFAMTQDDVSVEISDWGVWRGPEAIRHLFEEVMNVPRKGTVTEHHLTTPMIEVAGDGQTAKAVFWSPGFEILPTIGDQAAGDPQDNEIRAYWAWGKYAADFMRENGTWKIWHLKWFRLLRTDYYKSPVDAYRDVMTGAPNRSDFPGVQPPTFHHPYSADDERTPVPVNPEPYESYQGEFDWWFGEWKDRLGYVPPQY